MKIYENGIYREMTEDEIKEYNNTPSIIVEEPYLDKKLRLLDEVNHEQDALINISLMATDEVFMMIEPLLEVAPINERGLSKMIDMYVAMIIRGLKTIEEVPARYREEVKKVLAQLDK